jgi:transcriptional regulator with XRE-family HTH domain
MMRMNKIGQKIKKIRELRDFSRHYVASQLEISITTYGKIERDEIDITLTRLSKIAEILNVTITSIIDFDENKLFAKSSIKAVR